MDSESFGCTLGVFLCLMMTVAGCAVGHSQGKSDALKDYEQKCVDGGYAKWTVDQKTGKSSMEWLNEALKPVAEKAAE